MRSSKCWILFDNIGFKLKTKNDMKSLFTLDLAGKQSRLIWW